MCASSMDFSTVESNALHLGRKNLSLFTAWGDCNDSEKDLDFMVGNHLNPCPANPTKCLANLLLKPGVEEILQPLRWPVPVISYHFFIIRKLFQILKLYFPCFNLRQLFLVLAAVEVYCIPPRATKSITLS